MKKDSHLLNLIFWMMLMLLVITALVGITVMTQQQKSLDFNSNAETVQP